MAIVDGHIQCSGCRQMQPIASFPPSVVKRGHGRCSPCAATYSADRRATDPAARERDNAKWRDWYRSNSGKHNARTQDYYRRNPGLFSDRHLQRTYGITLAQYEALLVMQNGGCAICGKRQGIETKKLGVDHDHCTGRIRGLLCSQCNRGLGKFGDSIEGIKRVLAYLENERPVPAHPAQVPTMKINLLRGAN